MPPHAQSAHSSSIDRGERDSVISGEIMDSHEGADYKHQKRGSLTSGWQEIKKTGGRVGNMVSHAVVRNLPLMYSQEFNTGERIRTDISGSIGPPGSTGVKSIGPRFQPASVQKENVAVMIDQRKMSRYFEALVRLSLMGLNTWFIASTYGLALDSIIGYDLFDVIVNGASKATSEDCMLGKEAGCFKYIRILLVQVHFELLAVVVLYANLFYNLRYHQDLVRLKLTVIHISGFSTFMYSPSFMLWRSFGRWLKTKYFYRRPNEGLPGSSLRRFLGVLVGVLLVAVSALLFVCKLSALAFSIEHHIVTELQVYPVMAYLAALNQLGWVKDLQWQEGAEEHLYLNLFWVRDSHRQRERQIYAFKTRIARLLTKRHGLIRGFLLLLSIEVSDESFVAYFVRAERFLAYSNMKKRGRDHSIDSQDSLIAEYDPPPRLHCTLRSSSAKEDSGQRLPPWEDTQADLPAAMGKQRRSHTKSSISDSESDSSVDPPVRALTEGGREETSESGLSTPLDQPVMVLESRAFDSPRSSPMRMHPSSPQLRVKNRLIRAEAAARIVARRKSEDLEGKGEKSITKL